MLDRYNEGVARLLAGIRDADTRKAYQEVFDTSTVETLLRLRERGFIGELGRVISTGKEANVFYATDSAGNPLAIKIYRINTSEFRHLWKYVEGDPHFRISKRNRRSIIFEWAKREFRNLEKAFKAGVSVPFPVVQRKNILVMEYVGGKQPAPLLKNVEAPPGFYHQLLDNLSLLYFRAAIIHADLSEYNILVWDGKPYIIDMGQSVGWEHPLAYEFFLRDMHRLSKILKRGGIEMGVQEIIRELKERTASKGESVQI